MSTSKPKRRRVSVKNAPGVYRSISGSYEIAYRDSDGKLRFKVVQGSLEDAKKTRADVISRLGRGEQIRHDKRCFAQFAQEVVDGLQRAERTIEKHELNVRVRLVPRFGTKKLGEINTNAVARLVADMQRQGYAPLSIASTLSTLSLVMRRAKRQGLIAANPVADLDKDERPQVTGGEKRILDEAEIERLLANAGDTFRVLIALMLFSGVRLAEALGLTWADVDLKENWIHVRAQLDRKRQRVPKPKTDAGRRSIVLMPDLARILREHRVASVHSRDADFLFPAPDGRGRDHRSASRGVQRAVERAELGEGISSHSFRHTFASMLITGLKYEAVTVSKQLGHKKPTTTLAIYAHEFEKARGQEELRSAMDAGLGHMLRDVNGLSTSGRKQIQPPPAASGLVGPIRG